MLDQRQLVILLGEPGTGKSCLSARLAALWPSNRVWVYAPNDSKHFAAFRHFKAGEQPPLDGNLIIIDDSAFCFTKAGFAKTPYDWSWLTIPVFEGRHHHCHIIFNIQSVWDMWSRIRRFASRIYIFRSPADDIEECVRLFGPKAAAAADLVGHQYIEIIRY